MTSSSSSAFQTTRDASIQDLYKNNFLSSFSSYSAEGDCGSGGKNNNDSLFGLASSLLFQNMISTNNNSNGSTTINTCTNRSGSMTASTTCHNNDIAQPRRRSSLLPNNWFETSSNAVNDEPLLPRLARARHITARVLEEIDFDLFNDFVPSLSTSTSTSVIPSVTHPTTTTNNIMKAEVDDDDDLQFDMADLEPLPLDTSRMLLTDTNPATTITTNHIPSAVRDPIMELFGSSGAQPACTTPMMTMMIPSTTTMMIASSCDNNNKRNNSSVLSDQDAISRTHPLMKRQRLVVGDRHCNLSSSSTTTTTMTPNNNNIRDDTNVNEEEGANDTNRFRPYQAFQWTDRFEELVAFTKVKGHCCVPHTYKENPALARWVKRQRYQYKLKLEMKPSTMTNERIVALEEIGFIWDSHGSSWMERFNELQLFRQQFGHCNVPSNYQPNTPLATWVKCQRRQYKLFFKEKGKKKSSSNMTPQRISQLESLGFEWELRIPTNALSFSVRPWQA